MTFFATPEPRTEPKAEPLERTLPSQSRATYMAASARDTKTDRTKILAAHGTVPRSTSMLALGPLAFEILVQSDSPATRMKEFVNAPFAELDGELLWIGAQAHGWHPRSVIVAPDLAQPHNLPAFLLHLNNIAQRQVWLEATPPWCTLAEANVLTRMAGLAQSTLHMVVAHADPAVRLAHLLEQLAVQGDKPRGLGLLLPLLHPRAELSAELSAGQFARALPPPLDLARPRLAAFFSTAALDDPVALEPHATALLGIGAGLTPSCDDFLGGYLLAKLLLDEARWRGLADALAAVAPIRTHRISATLLADTLRGETYGVLADFAQAWLAPAPENGSSTLRNCAHALVEIGHSSGWDMLTGFVLGSTRSTRSTNNTNSNGGATFYDRLQHLA